MAIHFEWSDEYSVGDATLDSQHQSLFEIGNRLEQANLEEAQGIVLELFRYCREHFTAEEAHMQELGYPDLGIHCELHNRLIDDLNAVVMEGLTDVDQMDAFLTFFRRWLIEHVMYQDKKYFDFCRE